MNLNSVKLQLESILKEFDMQFSPNRKVSNDPNSVLKKGIGVNINGLNNNLNVFFSDLNAQRNGVPNGEICKKLVFPFAEEYFIELSVKFLEHFILLPNSKIISYFSNGSILDKGVEEYKLVLSIDNISDELLQYSFLSLHINGNKKQIEEIKKAIEPALKINPPIEKKNPFEGITISSLTKLNNQDNNNSSYERASLQTDKKLVKEKNPYFWQNGKHYN